MPTFPKTTRIARKAEIDLVYREGRRASDQLMRVHVRPNDLGFARLAISVPRRLCNAVKRNRWKRMIRESFRLNREKLSAIDLLAIPNRKPDGLKRPEVEKALMGLIRRANRKGNK